MIFLKIERSVVGNTATRAMKKFHTINSSLSCVGVSAEIEAQAYQHYKESLAEFIRISDHLKLDVQFEFKMRVVSISHGLDLTPIPHLSDLSAVSTTSETLEENRTIQAMRTELETVKEEYNRMKAENQQHLSKATAILKNLTEEQRNLLDKLIGVPSAEPRARATIMPFTQDEVNLLGRIPKEEFPLLYAAAQKTHKEPEAVCRAMTEDAYQSMLKAKAATEASTPVLETPPEVILQPKTERPDYNHKLWPSPRTKRIAKKICKRICDSSDGSYDGICPKSIKTHQDALNYLAKHAKISVEDLLKISEDEYKRTYVKWSITCPYSAAY